MQQHPRNVPNILNHSEQDLKSFQTRELSGGQHTASLGGVLAGQGAPEARREVVQGLAARLRLGAPDPLARSAVSRTLSCGGGATAPPPPLASRS